MTMPNTMVSTLFSVSGTSALKICRTPSTIRNSATTTVRATAQQRIGDDVEADDDVEDAEDGHEDAATGRSIGCPRSDDLHRAAEHQRDADDDRGDERGVDHVREGDEADDHEEDSDADEPLPATAEGFVGRGGHERHCSTSMRGAPAEPPVDAEPAHIVPTLAMG